MEWLDGRGPNRSMATSRQCPSGSGVGLSGSRGSGLATVWHPWQDLQCLSAALSIPGHHTFDRRCCFVPTIPKCPSWASASACARKACGNTVRVPLRTRYPTVHSSPAITAYGLHFSKCPVSMASRTSWSSGSAADASSTSRVVSALGVAFTTTNLTYSSDPCSSLAYFALLDSSLDSGSAMLFFPAMWMILNSYGCSRRTHRSIRAQGLERGP